VEALQRAGARIEYVKSEGYFPLLVHGRDGVMHEQNSSITMDASLSSQFVSSALMGGARRGLELVLTGKLVSQPYVVMTAALMRRFGVNVVAAANGARFSVPASECYVNPPSIDVEADASSATYPLAFAALSPGLTVTVSNLGSSSLQGDASFALLLERIGCKVQQTAETTTVTGPARLTAIPELNMADQTDAFLTMAVVAACCEPGQTTRIVGIANQRVKECDRIAAVAEGLRKCGVRAEELEDGIAVTAGFASNVSERKLIRCFKDHRVAMSFAVLGLRVSGVVLLDKGCVEKTFPSFWNMIASAEFGMRVDAAPEREKEEELVDNRHVVLIGMRGAGKTTLGAELARALGRRFVDADRELEARNDGLALPELVKKVGMDEFRRREAVLLEELLQQHSLLVVACGGGVVETELGQKVLRAAGNAVVVHVRRDVSELMAFLANDAARVPLAEPMQNVWARREPLYEALARREVFWSSVFPPCLRQLERTVRAVLEPQLLPSPCRIGRWTSMVCLTLPSYVHETEELEIHGDALELRADLLRGVAEAKGDETEGAIAGLLRLELAAVRRLGGGRPVVFTLRSASEGGQFCGTQLFYERSLRVAARLGFDALDVECVRMTETLRLQLEEERNSVALLVSEHHMDQAVSHGLLASMASRCLAACSPRFRHAVTVKLVCGALPDDAVRSADVVRGFVQGWDQIPQLLCVLSGERGVLSRVLAPRLSPCRVERAPPAAPGQVGAAKLRSLQSDLGVLSVAKLQLFGTPISRSPSPSIHNAAFGVLGVPLAYGLHETGDADELKRVVTSPVFVGGNVTLPLKEAAFALCHRVSLAARVVGAVNVLWRDESSGMLFGDNTDWRGMAELVARASTKRRIGDDLRVLVLGAGGTARAAVLAARAVGAGRVAVYNRSVARAQALAKDLSSKDFTVLVVDRLEGPAPHIVLGCLPGDAAAPPFPDSWRSGNVDVLLESAYRPRVTPTIAALQAKTVIYGEELLLEQAVWGSQIWTARAAPREEMAKAMAAFL
jgi:pentafunctional AROM polypeptide